MQPSPTACLIIIGNEILSGRTQDINLGWLAKELNELGIRVSEARVIPDTEAAIVETVNACRARFTYVFTTGGIGPTHDDITSEAIAKAFAVPFVRNKQAQVLLEKHYGGDINEARLSMADMPEGATLIANPVSIAPGFHIENVYVLAGVPRIMQAMFADIRHNLKGGKPMRSKCLSAFVTEGMMAAGVTAIQEKYPQMEIGSYPFVRQQKLGTSLVARATDEKLLEKVTGELRALMQQFTDEIQEE